MDLLLELIGDKKTNNDTIRFLTSKRLDRLRSRPILSNYFTECIKSIELTLDKRGPLKCTDICYQEDTRSYANTYIYGACALLLLRGQIFVKRKGRTQYFFNLADYPNNSDLVFDCKNILTLQKMVGQ